VHATIHFVVTGKGMAGIIFDLREQSAENKVVSKT
jgi:hypothetical protein